ncbi:fasciclin domain-containing protein [Aequorivita todarodis]|uniref:fasciclin domain-containing protein n=1 Tax=Aequorivita todarodis TaxID=2036821 RepID=UPI0023501624|nr:fasciclin domain-containing protein [Aequorivita todarodis]MDC8000740.1 fasciclin domain-containing protein [Aequorivita todarodis]
MPKPFAFLLISMFILFTFSCKNEAQDAQKTVPEKTAVDTVKKPPVKRAPKKDLTPEDIAVIQSVMARIMAEPHLKKYASYLVTAGMGTMLSEDKGPFTVFAPSSVALESLTAEKKKFYATPDNNPKLEAMLKSYIVSGKMDKETLLQTIDKSGRAKLKTLAGTTLTATKSGEDIVISDGKGAKANVVKGSIEGSNGVVYVVDGLLGAN